MAQLYFGRDNVATQALRNFNDMGQRDEDKRESLAREKFDYAKADRDDKFKRWAKDQWSAGERYRIDAAERQHTLTQKTTADIAGTNAYARQAIAEKQFYASNLDADQQALMNERNWGIKQIENWHAGMSDMDRSLTSLNDNYRNDLDKSPQRTAMYQETYVDRGNEFIKQDALSPNGSSYDKLWRGGGIVPGTTTWIPVADGKTVLRATHEDGSFKYKTVGGEETDDPNSIVTPHSLTQMGDITQALNQGNLMFSKQSPFLAKQAGAQAAQYGAPEVPIAGNTAQDTQANGNRPVPFYGGAATPATGEQTAPATETAAPAEGDPQAVNLKGETVTSPSQVAAPADAAIFAETGDEPLTVDEVKREVDSSGLGPEVIVAKQDHEVAKRSGNPRKTQEAGVRLVQAFQEDYGMAISESTGGPGEDVRVAAKAAQVAKAARAADYASQGASSPDTMLAPLSANTPTPKGVPQGLMQQIAAQLQGQGGTQDVAPSNMSGGQAADFYNTGQSGYATPQTPSTPQIRSLLGDTAPADRPLVPTSMAGWKEDIGADLRGMAGTVKDVYNRMKPVPSANAGIERQAPAAQEVAPAAQEVAPETTEAEGPSLLQRTWDKLGNTDVPGRGTGVKASRAVTNAVDRARGPVQRSTPAQRAAVEYVAQSSQYPGPSVQPKQSTDLRRNALRAQRLEDNGASAGEIAMASRGKFTSINQQVASAQIAEDKYNTQEAIEQRIGVYGKDGSHRPWTPKDTQEKRLIGHLGTTAQRMMEGGFDAITQTSKDSIRKELAKEGIDINMDSPADAENFTRLVGRVYMQNRETMKAYAADVGAANTNLYDWTEAQRESLVKQIASEITAPGWWRRSKNWAIHAWPFTSQKTNNPGASIASDNQLTRMQGSGDPAPKVRETGLRAIKTEYDALNQR
jgi:hypothetical protein